MAKKERSSGLELLRIIAMLMVFGHHVVLYNGVSIWNMPFSTSRLFLTVGLFDMGKVGVLVFFTITAWFLCGSSNEGGVRQSLRRIWLMEREVLFYSLTIYLIFRLGGLGCLKDGDGWKAAFPLTRSLWWYPTAYASFIVLEPMARRGLKAMGRREHGLLTATVMLMWGLFQGLIRTTSFTADSVVVFIAIYVAICYIRWYHDNLPAQTAGAMVALGFVALIAQGVRGGLISPTDKEISIWLSYSYKLPVILISIGLVSLFSRLNFRSGAINFVARSTFGAYLISEYPAMRTLLWKSVFVFGDWATGPWAIPMSVGCVLASFGLCATADLLRRSLFKLTIDRRPGAVFDGVWQRLESIPARFQDWQE